MSDFNDNLAETFAMNIHHSEIIPETTANIALVWELLRRNNPELPPRHHLTDEHEADLASSGISVAQAAHAGIFSADSTTSQALTGYSYSGLMFPYFDRTGRPYLWADTTGKQRPFMRLKPDPGCNSAAKYLSPKGAPAFVYVPRTANYQWADRKGDFKSGQKVIVTEGEKKSLCATLNNMPCLGLGGVDSYKTGVKPAEGEVRDLGFFIEEFNVAAQESVTVIYDSDIIVKPQIQKALKSFVSTLVEAYAHREIEAEKSKFLKRTLRLGKILKYSLLPSLPDQKIGLDDAIVRWGAAAVRELIDSAMPLCLVNSHEKEPERAVVTQLFCAEPLGDGAHKKSPTHLQTHNRSLIAHLTLMGFYAASPTRGKLHYALDLGIWQPIDRDHWTNLPQRVADLNGWKNRSPQLVRQHQMFLADRLAVAPDRFDATRLLGFQNGVLDVDSLKFSSHAPTNYLTQRLGFDYDVNAGCDRFFAWLLWTFAEQMPDGSFDEEQEVVQDRINLVQGLLRWSLEPKDNTVFPVETFIYLIGMPGLGKGTFLEILKGLSGESAGHWDLRKICDPNGVASFAGKQVAINSELKGSLTSASSEAINKITTNEEIGIKRLYHDLCSARCNTVLWAASNSSILSDTADRQGVDRRTVYLRFTRKPGERDQNLKSRLLAELPGIFNWVFSMTLDDAIDAITRYRQGSDYLEAQRTALADSNSVYQWIIDTDNREVACPCGIETRRDILHDLYAQWCSRVGATPLKQRNFTRELVKAGATVKTNPYYAYTVPLAQNISIEGMAGL
jgi:phage/plasmid-associated DNA primase